MEDQLKIVDYGDKENSIPMFHTLPENYWWDFFAYGYSGSVWLLLIDLVLDINEDISSTEQSDAQLAILPVSVPSSIDDFSLENPEEMNEHLVDYQNDSMGKLCAMHRLTEHWTSPWSATAFCRSKLIRRADKHLFRLSHRNSPYRSLSLALSVKENEKKVSFWFDRSSLSLGDYEKWVGVTFISPCSKMPTKSNKKNVGPSLYKTFFDACMKANPNENRRVRESSVSFPSSTDQWFRPHMIKL